MHFEHESMYIFHKLGSLGLLTNYDDYEEKKKRLVKPLNTHLSPGLLIFLLV